MTADAREALARVISDQEFDRFRRRAFIRGESERLADDYLNDPIVAISKLEADAIADAILADAILAAGFIGPEEMNRRLAEQRERIAKAIEALSDNAGGGDVVRRAIWMLAIGESARAARNYTNQETK